MLSMLSVERASLQLPSSAEAYSYDSETTEARLLSEAQMTQICHLESLEPVLLSKDFIYWEIPSNVRNRTTLASLFDGLGIKILFVLRERCDLVKTRQLLRKRLYSLGRRDTVNRYVQN